MNAMPYYGLQRMFSYRHTAMDALSVMDPIGVELRSQHRLKRRLYSNKGTNFLLHIDGFDKLKPYGFPIHGAICGYVLCVVRFFSNLRYCPACSDC
jgi:hypothetical protein